MAKQVLRGQQVQVSEDWHLVGTTGEPAFQNSWVNYGLGDSFMRGAMFRKDENGIVHLQGLVMNGTAATPIFTLPVGYRPLEGTHGVNIGSATASPLTTFHVYANGEVRHRTGNTDYFSLDGISFRAEQ